VQDGRSFFDSKWMDSFRLRVGSPSGQRFFQHGEILLVIQPHAQ
jgi:hypothetical protein